MRIIGQISSIIVVLLFVYAINFKSILTINYLVNTSEITELFCINKEKPQLECNGKCFLATQLIDVEKDKTESPFSNHQLAYNFDVFSTLINSFSNISTSVKNIVNIFYYNSIETIEHDYSVPSPPPKV